MINEQGILETPYNLATLSQATGNPILDLGYQCCDMRPYFEYKKDNVFYYTTVHPKNLILSVINVYEKYVKNVDGLEYDAMKYIGNTTATSGTTITFNDVVYTYTENIVNIRGFYINKWAAYKPVKSTTSSELSDVDRFGVGINGGIKPEWPLEERDVVNLNEEELELLLTEMLNNNFYWIYESPEPNDEDWFRMTDFIGYYKNAESPFDLMLGEGTAIGYPTNDGFTEYFPSSLEGINIQLNEVVGLNEYNLSREKLPLIFKQDGGEEKLFGAGLIYNFNGKYLCTNTFNGDEFVAPFNETDGVYKAIVELPNPTYGDYIIGGYTQTAKSTDQTFLWPVKPLKIRLSQIPPMINWNYEWSVENNKLLNLTITITRNGNHRYWGNYFSNYGIGGMRIITEEGRNDYYAEFKFYNGTALQESSQDTPSVRCILSNSDLNWNGWEDANTQAEIETPNYEITKLYNNESEQFLLQFPEQLKETVQGTTYTEVSFSLHLGLYHVTTDNPNLVWQQQVDLVIDDAQNIFEDLGWI